MFDFLLGLLQRAGDWLWGYDFFISYSHGDSPREGDGSHRNQYVKALARELRARRFSVFLDTAEYHPGEDLSAATIRRVRSSRKLILVARPFALQSPWVRREVETALAWRREVVVLDINGTFQAASLEHPLRQLIPDAWLRRAELIDDFDGEPSVETVRALHEGFHKVRRETLRQRLIATTAVVLGVLAALATWAAMESRRQERIAKFERDEAIRRRKVSFAQSLSRDAVRQDGALSVLLAAEAYHFGQESHAPVRNVIDDSLRSILQRPLWNEFKLPNEIKSMRGASAAWMRDGNTLVMGTAQQGLQLVELDSNVARARTFDQSLGLSGFYLASDAKTLVGLTDKKGVRVWNLENPSKQPAFIPLEFPENVSFAVSADGSTMIATTPQSVRCCRLQANPNWIELHRFAAEDAENESVSASISTDGKFVVFGYVDSEATLSLWMREIAEGAESKLAYQGPFVSEGGVGFHISRTKEWVIATGGLAEGSGPVLVWKRSQPMLQGPWRLSSPGESVASLAFSPDEKFLAVGGSSNPDGIKTGIIIYHLTALPSLSGGASTDAESDAPKESSSTQAYYQSLRCDNEAVSCVQFSDDGQTLVSADGTLLRVWRKVGENFDQKFLTLAARSQRVRSIIVGPKAGWIRAIDEGPTISHFELTLAPGAAVALQEDRFGWTSHTHQCVAWSPDGQTLVASELGGTTIDVWRPGVTRKRLEQIKTNYIVEDLSFSPDGKYLSAACQNGSIELWLADGFRSLPGLPPPRPQKGRCKLAFHPNLPQIVLGLPDGTVLLRGLQSESATQELERHVGGVASVGFSPNGAWIASAGKNDKRICLWNARKAAIAPTIVRCPASVVELAFDTTGEALFFVDVAGEIRRLELTSPYPLTTLGKGPESPTCLAFSADGRTLAVGGNQEQLQLWDPRQLGHPVEIREVKLCFTDLAFSPDSQQLACSSYGRMLHSEDNNDGKLLLYPTLEGLMTSARAAAWRNLTQEEWNYFIAPDIKYRETFPLR